MAAVDALGSPGRSGVGRLLAMPFLIINMGTEMLYILEQRLQAQSIASEKSRKGAETGAPTAGVTAPLARFPRHLQC